MANQILDRQLHIKAIDAYIDPGVPRARAIITHGHVVVLGGEAAINLANEKRPGLLDVTKVM